MTSLHARPEIENLISTYAELVDAGNFSGVGELLAAATFIGSGKPVRGAQAIEDMYLKMLLLYDGVPKTKHVTTNTIVDHTPPSEDATARSYFTAFQALDGFPLQPIVSGRYFDRFSYHAGRWAFSERRVKIDLTGDVSRHLRTA